MTSLSRRFETPTNWNSNFTEQVCFADLAQILQLQHYRDFPCVAELNKLGESRGFEEYQFIDDAQIQTLNDQELYYEEVIFQKHLIPTRFNNWHDLFNAAIWLLFPKSKAFLNEIHIQEIQSHGLNPRTAVRNRVTHFDECGGILVYQQPEHLDSLQNHCWIDAFVEQRSLWNNSTRFFIFGHANYEMLLAPYIGLTAKYLPLKVQSDFWAKSLADQYRYLDAELMATIKEWGPFKQKGALKPLPLLGIPGWWSENESKDFYLNKDYFRPLRK